MTAHEFNNQASQAERKAIVKNDSYFARQTNTVDDAGGRFAKLTPNILTGQTQQVPQQPASSYWAQGLDEVCGPEPAFGVDVNAQEALGTPNEIQSSLDTVRARMDSCFSLSVETPAVSIPEEPTPSVASSAGVGSDGPVALPSVVNLAATEAKSLAGSSTFKRRVW